MAGKSVSMLLLESSLMGPLLPIRRFLGTIVDGMVAPLPVSPSSGLISVEAALRILLISTQSI